MRQFIKFGFVGLSNTVIAYVVYSSMVYLGIHYQLGNLFAFIVSSLSGYFINKIWVFKTEYTKPVFEIVKYYTVYLLSLLLTLSLSYVWIDLVGMNPYIAPVVNLAFVYPINFITSKFWIYKNI